MFKCTLCSFSNTNKKIYVAHVKHFHCVPGFLPEFVCPFEECNHRRYSNVNSFHSHIALHEKRQQMEIELEKLSTIIDQPTNYSPDTAPHLSEIVSHSFKSSSDSGTHQESECITSHTSHTITPILCHQQTKHSHDTAQHLSETVSHKSSSDILNILQTGFRNLALKLYANESLPRNKTQMILDQCQLLIQSVFSELKIHIETIDISQIKQLLETLSGTQYVQSEYMFKKSLSIEDKIVPVIHYVLDEFSKETKFAESVQIKQNSRFLKLVDLNDLFTKLFALPNFLQGILDYQSELSKDNTTISNVIQTPFWKTKVRESQLNTNTLYLPINIYFDDFEPLNALGSHSGAYKIGGVYCTLPSLPVQAQSMLKYIFLGSLFFTDDRKDFGNSKVFLPFIEILNMLQTEGIQVDFGCYTRVKLVPFAIIGDNLGLNSMLGFVESFNSFHYCRLCKSHKKDMSKNTLEDNLTLRTRANYEQDLQLDDVSLTGIKENSVWNKLLNFNVTENYSVDIMYDLLEGVCHYDLTQILQRFIYEYKLFSLDKLNQRIQEHNFGPHLTNTNIAYISKEMLIKYKIQTSASEMYNLFMHFGLIIGDLFDLCDAPEWCIYISLREIISIAQQKVVHINQHEHLQSLISEHHDNYIKYFGPLKPKHHFMTHYARIQKTVGPLSHLSSIRFESFHRKFKNIAKSTQCRKNILQTFAIKYQMQLSDMMAGFTNFNSKLSTSPPIEVDPRTLFHKYRILLNEHLHVLKITWAETALTKFKLSSVVQKKTQIDEIPEFGLIVDMFLIEDSLNLCCKKLTTLGFDEHRCGYVVEPCDLYYLVKVSQLISDKQSYVFYGPMSNIVLW